MAGLTAAAALSSPLNSLSAAVGRYSLRTFNAFLTLDMKLVKQFVSIKSLFFSLTQNAPRTGQDTFNMLVVPRPNYSKLGRFIFDYNILLDPTTAVDGV